MDKQELVTALNHMLAHEHACAIRYATHASVVTGPYAESVAARLKEIAGDELSHAEQLRDRIVALDGKPTMEILLDDLKSAYTLEDILAINIEEEHDAIKGYTEILHETPRDEIILFRTIEDIIRDEQEHLEELENLKI